MCHWRRLLVWQGGRGDGRVVCLARSSPAHPPHSLYTHTPLALFKATHSCGNVSIVTPWTLFGKQLGAGIWAEACVRIWACACVAASGSCTEESAHAELEALSFLPHPGDKLREIWGTRDGKCWQLQVLRLKDTPPTHPPTHTHLYICTHTSIHLTPFLLSDTATISVKKAKRFVMSESPGVAIQQKVKGSVGKGWCTKPSLPLSVALSRLHTRSWEPLQHPPPCSTWGPYLQKHIQSP